MTDARTKPVFTSAVPGRCLAAALVGVLLILSGTLYAQTVAHAVQHAHHQKATHASVLCSWMCAAGQVMDGVIIHLPEDRGPQVSVNLPVVSLPDSPARPNPASRGPPFFSC